MPCLVEVRVPYAPVSGPYATFMPLGSGRSAARSLAAAADADCEADAAGSGMSAFSPEEHPAMTVMHRNTAENALSMSSPFHVNGIQGNAKGNAPAGSRQRRYPPVSSLYAGSPSGRVSCHDVPGATDRAAFLPYQGTQRLRHRPRAARGLFRASHEDRRMEDIGRSAAGRELGMGRAISRRDFFDGVAVTAGAAALPGPARPGAVYAAAWAPGAAFRGNTSQALGVLHALRDGRFWQQADPPEPTGERYDLVVVGAGLSGVSAAHEWLRRHPGARVLILDNHDTTGGHLQRPGSGSMAAPATWTPEFRDLLDGLGVAAAPCQECGADDSVMCDRETFPVEVLVRTGAPAGEWIGVLP